jgi:tRNA 2-thiouridine synthesizing protein A
MRAGVDVGQCAPTPAGENGCCAQVPDRLPDPARQCTPQRVQFNRGDLAVNFDRELDARGLSCPLPILKTKKTLNELASGQVLKVIATDPGSVKDMQAFANQTGNPLLSSAEENKDYIFFLKKK